MQLYKRHLFYWRLLRPLVLLFLKVRFGYRYKKAEGLPETYIVLSNHVTDYDPLFVAASFPKQMYFVASEHITRWGAASAFLKYCFAPIIRYKGTTAASTVMEMIRKVREKKSVCMFAEGARSWDGVTAPIQPATAKVIKSAKCALVTYRIEGGYFVSPNWSEGGIRRGPIYGAPVNIYTMEQLAAMSVEEIHKAITEDLYEDAYERQKENPVKYKGKQPAVRLENLLFLCPECKTLDSMHSEADRIICQKCGRIIRYNAYGMLEDAPFETVRELAVWQKKQVRKAAAERAVYTSPAGTLSAIVKGEEILIAKGPVSLSEEALTCGETVILRKDILDMAMHGRHAIVFSTPDGYYELLPDRESNALKFHWLYEAYKTGNVQ